MADSGYYLRLRGRVTGPYDLPALQTLVRRGAVSRIHEISRDAVAWSTAGAFDSLFPRPAKSAAVPLPAAPQAPAAPGPHPPPLGRHVAAAAIAAGAAPPKPPVSDKFYYSHGGATVGPVPFAMLRSLAASGKLERTAQVWAAGAEARSAASRVPGLQFPSLMKTAGAGDGRRGRLLRWVLAVAAAIVLLLASAWGTYYYLRSRSHRPAPIGTDHSSVNHAPAAPIKAPPAVDARPSKK